MARYTTDAEVSFLQSFAKNSKLGIVEIGVLDGETTARLAEVSNVYIYGIDPIIPDSKADSLIGDISLIKSNMRRYSKFKFYWDYSYKVVKGFRYKFDFIFFDGGHEYADIHQDYVQWYPLLASGGFMAFHDSAPVVTIQPSPFGGWDGPTKLVEEIYNSNTMNFMGIVDTITVFQKR